ncbi:hypothetical protein QMP26_05490 [Enterocloster clostridioformis]|uniref:hypothetical protein n=1 Tax=Enterocloster clostridioformis TaxID=1531 RepID=UPI0026759196|nr:hypothetical protein [Enterocloster clostridioformis]
MESQMEKENSQAEGWTTGVMFQTTGGNGEGEWIETNDDCAQFCRCLGPDEYEFVQINHYLSDSVFYTISHGTVCLQDFFMEQIDSILKSYGYRYPEYGSPGMNAEAAPGSQQIAEMVFETYFKEYEEERQYEDYMEAVIRVGDVINRRNYKQVKKKSAEESDYGLNDHEYGRGRLYEEG